MCSHHRTCAGKYLFRQKQKGWQVAQPSARTQNDALRKLAQKLPEQDNQPTIIDGLKGIREINDISPCLRPCRRQKRPSLRRNRPSLTVMFLSSVEERRFSVPAYAFTECRAQRPSREARSRAEPRAAASLWRAWRARRALDLDGRCARRNA